MDAPPVDWEMKYHQLARENGKLRKYMSRLEAEKHDLRHQVRELEKDKDHLIHLLALAGKGVDTL